MAKLTLSDLTNLQNEQTAVSTINANNAAIEAAMELTLTRTGISPNFMDADLDMNSNRILNLPDALTGQEPVTKSFFDDTIEALEAGAVLGASYVVLGNDAHLNNERVFTAGENISITDAGAGSTVTVAVSGDDLNALEAITTDGLVARTGDATYATRTITGTAAEIDVADGDGISGEPTISLPDALTFTGKTITGGTYTGATFTPSSLTLDDDTFTLQDDGDPTKQLQFQASSITTGTTRTLTAPDANTTIAGTDATQTLTNKTIALGSNTVSGTTAQFNTALTDGDFATLDGTQTLTNKTITLGNNTVTGTTAQFNTALTDNNFATQAGSETLTNKTLTSPVISTISNTGTVTLPTATDTLVGRATTDTLTNKSISGSTNTLSNVGLSSLANQAAYTLVGNNTGSSAAPTAVDIAAVTTKGSPGAGDYVLISDQAASGAWKKATVASVAAGSSVASVNDATGTIITGLDIIQNGSLAVSAAAGALTISLKDAAGNDPSAGSPVAINFRSATATTGTHDTLSVTAATSLVLSSGSTLGVTSATAFRIWIVGFDDAGTFRLGAINCSTWSALAARIHPLAESGVMSSNAEGGAGAADSAGIPYTGTAVTGKAFRVLGYLEWNSSGLTTAGTWTTTNLANVQSYGPAIRLPGAVVQVGQTGTVTQVNNATATPASAVSQAMSPTSAVNLLKVSVIGTAFTPAVASQAIITILRGSTQIYSQNVYHNSVVGVGPISMTYYDKPNTVSSTTYHGAIHMNAGGSGGFPYAGGGSTAPVFGSIIVEEIVG